MKILNISEIPGRKYEVIGLVKGSVVQGVAKDIMSKWQSFVGGEMKSYTKMLNEARYAATKRMAEEAENLHADAIYGVAYTSTHIMPGAVEIVAYGTAVKFIGSANIS